MSFLGSSYIQQTTQQQILPYTFTTGELETLKTKLQSAESTMLQSPQKVSQAVIQLSLSEIRSLQKMIDMTYLQGMSGLNSIPVQPELSHLSLNSTPTNHNNGNNNKMISSSNNSSNNSSNPGPNYVCHKCGVKGHYVHDCPNVQGRGNPPPNYVCHKCHQKGHWIQDCQIQSNVDYNKPPPPNYTCHRCHVPGHWIKNCPTNDKNSQTFKSNENGNISSTKISNNGSESLIGKKRNFGEI